MTVFVTGATGVVGHRLVECLADRGHEVHGLVRNDAGAVLVGERGGEPRQGDVLEPETLERAIDGDVDVLVHAATAIPTSMNPSDDEWARNDRVRLEGARNLLVAADGLEQVVFPSVVWLARQPDGSAFDEDAERHPHRTTRTAAEVEDLLRERAADRGFDAAILRYGFFYAADAAHTRLWGESLLDRDMPIVGGGLLGRRDAELSLVHADDAARAAAEAVDAGLDGVYHVVDEEPATLAAVLRESADLLAAPAPRRIPAWLARFVVGSLTTELLTSPMPTSAARFRRATDWEPAYPTYREGLRQVVDAWLEDGTLAETEEGYEWTG